MRYALALCATAALLAMPGAAVAQDPPEYIVMTYQAAPGHQVELVRWLAQQDRISEAAGTPRMRLFVHTNGDSWDLMVVQPVTTAEQDRAFEAAATRLGISQGPRVGVELRRHIASHADTHVVEVTPAQYLAAVGSD